MLYCVWQMLQKSQDKLPHLIPERGHA